MKIILKLQEGERDVEERESDFPGVKGIVFVRVESAERVKLLVPQNDVVVLLGVHLFGEVSSNSVASQRA